jgi:hypothetical protein
MTIGAYGAEGSGSEITEDCWGPWMYLILRPVRSGGFMYWITWSVSVSDDEYIGPRINYD